MPEDIDDMTPWYALRMYGCRALKARDYFVLNGAQCFVPMRYHESSDAKGNLQRRLVPVVNNLLFVKKTMTDADIQRLVAQSGMNMAVMTKGRDDSQYYEIPASQMHEFQMMCNPDIYMHQYLTQEEAELKAGTKVVVRHGPLKGLSGRLVRHNRKYFLLKEVPGMAVMLKVTRWCCVPVAE